jgi:UDP-GlcNAc:undecaprenyl-phosphate GlcNAc-1-phosphate transferase
MTSLIWLGCVSFGLALILTPIFRDIFRSYNVVDEPDMGRKLHKIPIPRVGGMAIALAYTASFFLVPLFTKTPLDDQLSLVWNLLPAAAVIFATGVIDDLFGLKPWQKLIGQVIAACIAYFAGVRILDVVGFSMENWWSLPITVFWLLTCTNAFNLVDGMDGLAAGVGLFATLTIFAAAIMRGNVPLAHATFPLAGCLLAFLCYNFNPATIFLGDSGSLLIGFMLGCYGVMWSQKSATMLGMTAPLMALSLPLLDVGLAIVRRMLKRQPIFSADRGHIHHRLLDRGLTPRRAVLVLYGICGLVAAFSLLQSVSHNDRISGVIIVLFCAVAWVGIQYLGYAEFSVAGRMLFSGNFQRMLKAQLDLQAFEKQVKSAQSIEELWKALLEISARFGFHCVRFDAAGNVFEGGAPAVTAGQRWSLSVPLGLAGQVEFTREIAGTQLPMIAGPFVEAVHTSLLGRLRELQERAVAPPVASGELANSESAG